ncbi:uncharacterized protein LOC132719331 [Ruditapes philippinarum]|uniref:uncharacterized protein LOC132719331 n=1 Tax=Ruditapes philippinarum TaxID=129788 RepID=UPI00295C2FD4|nr:uncharacterized protein LOC132719331 [Ruditapes philippinarum]
MEYKFWIALIIQIYPVVAMYMYVEIQRSYEFEDVLSEDQQDYWVWRSEASNLKTLRLVDHNQVYRTDFKICIDPVEGRDTVNFFLDDIRYANDGPNDTISVTFDGEYWDEYSTNEKWAHGHDWNIFRNSGRATGTKFLREGEYVIGVSVKTDKWGIELDKIRVIAEYQVLESDIFCGGRLVNTNYTWMQDDVEFIQKTR